MPKFAVRRLFLSICAGALGAMGPRSGLAESLPSPTLPQLLAADVIAVGHFELVQGKIQFLPRRMLKGDAAAGAALVAQFFVRATPDGKLIARSPDDVPMKEGYSEHDATLDAIWFLGPNDRQPLELADGFAALLAGKKPEPRFSLLQRFDFDQRQDAMEELFAQPDAVVVARLHTLALGDDVYLAADAAAILTRTKLFDPRQMWGKWLRAPATNFLIDALAQRDPVRTTQELAAAIAVEQDPQRLENMLYQISRAAPNRLELVLPYIDHPSANVRARVLVSIWDTLWELEAANTPESIRRFTELAPRILPLLQQRAAVETDPLTQRRLIEMLTPVNGVPWILAIPQGTLHGPIDSYTEDAELDFLVRCLTSRNQGGFISETAGREIARHFFDEGFLRLRNDVRSSNFNRETVYEGMTYVADPRALEYFKQNADPRGLMIIPRQNQPDSLALVKEFLAQHGKPGDFENVGTGVLVALADISDPQALDLLKSLKPQVTKSQKMSYLRALAMHGDAWAQGELLAAFQQPPAAQFLDADYWSRQGIAQILCMIDTPAATAALRQYVEEQWPKSSGARRVSAGRGYGKLCRRFAPFRPAGRSGAARSAVAGRTGARKNGLSDFRRPLLRLADFSAAHRATGRLSRGRLCLRTRSAVKNPARLVAVPHNRIARNLAHQLFPRQGVFVRPPRQSRPPRPLRCAGIRLLHPLHGSRTDFRDLPEIFLRLHLSAQLSGIRTHHGARARMAARTRIFGAVSISPDFQSNFMANYFTVTRSSFGFERLGGVEEFENRQLVVSLAGAEDRAGEVRLVGGVGEMLRFQYETLIRVIGIAVLAGELFGC